MTAPFAQALPCEAKAIMLEMVAVFASIPLAKRDDWVGWVALATLFAALVGLWGLLIRGWSRLD